MALIYYPVYPEKLNPIAGDIGLLADSQDLDVDGKKKFKSYKLGNSLLGVQVSNFSEFETYNNDPDITFITFASGEFELGANVITIQSDKTYFFRNTILTHTDTTKNFISAVNKENFILTGKLNIVGTRTVALEENLTENGLYVVNCSNFIIENISISDCRGIAIYKNFLGGSVTTRGNKGKWSNIYLDGNNYPFYAAAGGTAEYDVFVNITATNHTNPFSVYGGNDVFTGSNIVDNDKGVYIGSGANHAHGMFNGCNINHNRDFNLHIQNVTLGETFNGCHFYGDSIGGQGKILLENSRGVAIQNGHIDCMIEVIDGVSNGGNMVSGNFIAGTFTTVTGSGTGDLLIKNNFDINGLSGLNN